MRCFRSRHQVAAAFMLLARSQLRFEGTGTNDNGPIKSREAAVKETSKAAVGNILPGEELARRAATPNIEFPATWSSDEPLDPTDPRVLWREHFSLAEDKPYYQSLKTNEVTYTIPDGFVTRFPRLYERAGYKLDKRGAVFHTATSRPIAGEKGGDSSATSESEGGAAKEAGTKDFTMKEKLAAYGGGGLLWYLIVHNASLFGVFCALYFLHIDLVSIAMSYGFKVKKSEEVEDVHEPKERMPFFKTFVLAIVLNKILVPAHLLITLTTAPFLVHRLEPVAVRIFPVCKEYLNNLKGKLSGAATAKV